MFDDIKAVFTNDPAARNIFEVLLYQGLWAIWFHRLANLFYRLHLPILPRLVSQISRLLTGIEIHPGAKIGKCFFIDHGAGVVIGETTVIGENVTLFQGVTLGGTGKEKGKRHPTIGNDVVIGAGAIILGAITIGDNARIGAGAVVTKAVPADTTVVGNPCWIVRREGRKLAPLEHGSLPDPVHKAFDELNNRIKTLEEKLK
ncbi:serine O-acetyltransferase [candidate division WOR-1 bacterium RIFOXYB2_FULL_42_35]|uniref:Serine acetyltransferase n=1 Tax=candidate division WOR-1 bacterium RIFOXYC2_FULL_41_25 TaxID=1802586 RepID=A0A1F4TPM3_UNCSA|nr:MAG: serine O-acetyltransferase [candidate division WOR-1 bacterium RIFOXYB2_FULL_42_35]OGC24561.1 MAG: serine O-acetyltransferase [candidate division WOR-1 bacterium RIFOXYA2_FULL_41_14]OGC34606.1 MAG: serine O-acetyltransferase [candidate division WOR-1 bacterium RIFOXYC2_FULL_41_25]OGC43987.1 MAG: serine O-acetyltransferase [candidate division WOR-1 bacterium RIFOXYD2_FULL_41_8]